MKSGDSEDFDDKNTKMVKELGAKLQEKTGNRIDKPDVPSNTDPIDSILASKPEESDGWIYAGHFYPNRIETKKSKIIENLDLPVAGYQELALNKEKLTVKVINDVYMRNDHPREVNGARQWGSILEVVKSGELLTIQDTYNDDPDHGNYKVGWLKVYRKSIHAGRQS
jgi:hypothetical protein